MATLIVALRRLLMDGMVAHVRGDDLEHERLCRKFEREAHQLPLWLAVGGGLTRHVLDPCTRKVTREGILAQQQRRRAMAD